MIYLTKKADRQQQFHVDVQLTYNQRKNGGEEKQRSVEDLSVFLFSLFVSNERRNHEKKRRRRRRRRRRNHLFLRLSLSFVGSNFSPSVRRDASVSSRLHFVFTFAFRNTISFSTPCVCVCHRFIQSKRRRRRISFCLTFGRIRRLFFVFFSLISFVIAIIGDCLGRALEKEEDDDNNDEEERGGEKVFIGIYIFCRWTWFHWSFVLSILFSSPLLVFFF